MLRKYSQVEKSKMYIFGWNVDKYIFNKKDRK